MPNWCYTEYKFLGTTDNIQDAAAVLKTLRNTERPRCPGSFTEEPAWLGYLAEEIGLNPEQIFCRGEFILHSEPELLSWKKPSKQTCLSFDTETAWGPCTELMQAFASHFKLSANWYAEEPGMCEYELHDPDNVFDGRKYVYDNEEYGASYYCSWKDCLDDIRCCVPELPKKIKSYENVQNWLRTTCPDYHFVYRITRV